MELKVFRDTVAGYGGKWESRLELPVETELLIPDYLPPVFKIVKCRIEAVTLQNRVAAARWHAEGYLRCTVLYESEAEKGRLCRTEQKLPFEKTVELPAGLYREGPAALWGETEYCNCRAVNEHRIEVRGAYILCAAVLTRRECSLLTALADCGIEQRSRLLHGWRCGAAEEVTVTSEAAVPLPGEGAVVLDITGFFAAEGCTVQNGQVNCSGTLKMQVCSRAAELDEVTVQQKEIPVRQTVELNHAEQGDECVFWGEVEACTVTAVEQQSEPQLGVTWKLHLELWRRVEYRAVEDAYSTLCHTQTVRTNCKLLQLAERLDSKTQVVLEDALPQQDLVVQGCFVTLGEPGLTSTEVQEGKTEAKSDALCLAGKGVAHLICQDEHGELGCYDKPFTWRPEGRWDGATADAYACLHAAVTGVTSTKTGNTVRVTAEIQTTGALFLAQSFETLCDVELGEEYAPGTDDATLYLYYAAEGERIFDIAKRYHARAGDLAAANHLEAAAGQEETKPDATTEAGCLLIPAAL